MSEALLLALRQVDEPRVVRALASPSPAASEAAGAGSGAGVGECGGREWLECVLVCVRGQSFMLNQIRKMLGLAVAVVRGVAPDAALDLAFGPAKARPPPPLPCPHLLCPAPSSTFTCTLCRNAPLQYCTHARRWSCRASRASA